MNENWRTFDYTSTEGVAITVAWWPKDFTATFESDGIRLTYGLHIMYMCPKVYTEEMLRSGYCEDSCKLLKKAYDILQANPDFVENYTQQLNAEFHQKNSDLANLQEERRNKRKQFKAGELSQREWTSFCKEYNKAKVDDYCEKSDFTRCYVSRKAGGDISLQNILKDYLEAAMRN